MSSNYMGLGCSGCIIASILSWIVNKSIGWAIVHFFCSWFYVVYWAFAKTRLYDWLVSVAR